MYFQILLIKKKKKERIRYNKMTKINIVTRYNVKKIHNRSIIIQSNISKYQRFIWDQKWKETRFNNVYEIPTNGR